MRVTILLGLLSSILASIPVSFVRPNGEKANVGPGPGCFGIQGKVSAVTVPKNAVVAFYSEYSCKGSIVFDALQGELKLQEAIDAKSIEIFDLLDDSCSA